MNIHLKRSSVVCALLVTISVFAQQPAASSAGSADSAAGTPSASGPSYVKLARDPGPDIGEPVYEVGGSVQPPIVVHHADPEFSPEARQAKFSGNVIISLVVDSHGQPRNVYVLRGVGWGLDDRALQAVEKYRFKPALKHGRPVAVRISVEVNFISKDQP